MQPAGSVAGGAAQALIVDWSAKYAAERDAWALERTHLLRAVDEKHRLLERSEAERSKLVTEFDTFRTKTNALHTSHADGHREISALESTVSDKQAEIRSLAANLKSQADSLEQLMFQRTELKTKLAEWTNVHAASAELEKDGRTVPVGWIIRRLCATSIVVGDHHRVVTAVLDSQSKTLSTLQHTTAAAGGIGSPLRPSALFDSPHANGIATSSGGGGGGGAPTPSLLGSIDSLRSQTERNVRELSGLLASMKQQLTALESDRSAILDKARDKITAHRQQTVLRRVFGVWYRASRASTSKLSRRNELLSRHFERMRRQYMLHALQKLSGRISKHHTEKLIQAKENSYKQRVLMYRLKLFASHDSFTVKQTFAAWKLFVLNHRNAKHLLSRIVHHRARTALSTAWHHWNTRFVNGERRSETAVAWRLRLRSIFGKQLEASTKHVLEDTFHRWKQFVTKRKNYRRTVMRCLMDRRAGGVGRAFTRWREYCRQSEYEHALHVQAVAAQVERDAAEIEIQNAAMRVATACYNQRLRLLRCRLFYNWRQCVIVKELKFQALNQAYTVGKHGHEMRYKQTAFQHWWWLVKARAKRRDMLTHMCREIVIRGRSGNLHHAWTQWRRFVDGARNAETLYTQVTVVKKLLQAQKEHSAKSIIQRWRTGAMVPAFMHWRTIARESRHRKKELLSKTLARMHQGDLWRAWRHWTSFVEHSRVNALRVKMSDEKHKRGAEMIRRWRVQSLVPAFERWKEYAHERKVHKHTILRHTLARMFHSQLWAGWRQWRHSVEQDKMAEYRQRIFDQQNKRRVELIKRWRHSSLYPAFERWKEYIVERKAHKKDLLRRMLTRWQRTELWRGWRHWTSYVEHSKIAELKVRMSDEKHKRGAEIIRRWRLQSLIPTFERWKEFTHERRQHKHTLMRTCLMRLQQSKLWRGWRVWTQYVEHAQVADLKATLLDEKHKRKAVVIHKWRLQSLLPAFHAWKEHVRERKIHKKELLKRTLARWMRAELWRGWRVWTHYNEHEKIHGLKTRMVHEKTKRKQELIRRWRLQSLLPCWGMWREFVAERKRHKKDLLRRMIFRWGKAELWRAWRHWTQFADTHRVSEMRIKLTTESQTQKQKRIDTLIRYHRQRSLVPNWQLWRQFVAERKVWKKQLLMRTLKRWLRCEMWRGWRVWKGFVQNQKMDAMQRVFDRPASSGGRLITGRTNTRAAAFGGGDVEDGYSILRPVFGDEPESLRRLVEGRRERRAMALVRRTSSRCLRPVFRSWVEYARGARKSKTQLLTRTLLRLQQSSLWRGWRCWRRYTEHAKLHQLTERFDHAKRATQLTAQNAIKRMLIREGRATLANVFIQWRTVARIGATRRRSLCTRMLRRWCSVQVWRGWRQWTRFVSGSRATDHSHRETSLTAMISARDDAHSLHVRDTRDAARRSVLLRTVRASERRLGAERRSALARAFHNWRTYQWQLTALEAQSDALKLNKSLSALEADRSVRQSHEHRIKRDTLLLLQNSGAVHEQVLSYSAELQELRRRLLDDQQRVNSLRDANKDLSARLNSLQHKAHTQHRFLTQKTVSRATFFRTNQTLCRAFAAWYEFTQRARRRTYLLGRVCGVVRTVALTRAWFQWKNDVVLSTRHDTERALLSSRAHCDTLLRKISSLEYRLVQLQHQTERQTPIRINSSATDTPAPPPRLIAGATPAAGGSALNRSSLVAGGYGATATPRGNTSVAGGGAALLNTSIGGTSAFTSGGGKSSGTGAGSGGIAMHQVVEVDGLQRRVSDLTSEVNERGAHIQFLIDENAKLAALHDRHLKQLNDEKHVLSAAVVAVSGLSQALTSPPRAAAVPATPVRPALNGVNTPVRPSATASASGGSFFTPPHPSMFAAPPANGYNPVTTRVLHTAPPASHIRTPAAAMAPPIHRPNFASPQPAATSGGGDRELWPTVSEFFGRTPPPSAKK